MTVRTSLSATSLEPQIRREIQAVDPDLPVFNVRTMNEVIDGSLASRRFSAELVGVFAVVALLLASVGIYGLLAYMVGGGARDWSAYGAGSHALDHWENDCKPGVGLAGIGVGIGLILSGIMAPLISSLLYGVRPLDPEVFIAVPVILMVVVLGELHPGVARGQSEPDRRLASRELVSHPARHARALPHSHYHEFVEYGDAAAYHRRLPMLRRELAKQGGDKDEARRR